MIARCGRGDGAGKVCRGRVELLDNDPAFPEAIAGWCRKHRYVSIARSRFDQAEAAGLKEILLDEGEVALMLKERETWPRPWACE